MKAAGRPPRLDQWLSALGYCSRREVAYWLRDERITVDGEAATNPAARVDHASVRVDGEPLDHPNGLTVLMHKPAGYVCSHSKTEGASVFDLLPSRWLARHPAPQTVGRLDRDTTGTLLITDDGTLLHRLTSPRRACEKVYLAEIDREIPEEIIAAFASATLLLEGEQKPCLPARLEILEGKRARVTLCEGRYHQVKRMFAYFGLGVVKLHRTSFGGLSADDLAPGAWRDIDASLFSEDARVNPTRDSGCFGTKLD
ncbi:MAG: pseudouridine synthase [Verrucomicrobiia bacterium]